MVGVLAHLSIGCQRPPRALVKWPAVCRLDYPGIGPEHSFLKDLGRAEYHAVTDAEALEAFVLVSRLEGIIPALETSHAFAFLDRLVPTLQPGARVVINLSGRGDKDVNQAATMLPPDIMS